MHFGVELEGGREGGVSRVRALGVQSKRGQACAGKEFKGTDEWLGRVCVWKEGWGRKGVRSLNSKKMHFLPFFCALKA